MQSKEIKLKITDDSCIHIKPMKIEGEDRLVLNWNKHTKDDRVETYVCLSEAAAIKTAHAILAFFQENVAPSA